MAIPIKKEPDDVTDGFGVLEVCVFCGCRSRFWHEKTNNCVCESCAKVKKVSELINWYASK